MDDFAGERRWPRFAARERALGTGSMLSLQLYVEGENLAALNLYARRPHAFDDESEQYGLLFAAHAAVAIAGARHDEQMQAALDSRDAIGQAKGVLMERYRIGPGVAFSLLTRTSQDTNTKLIDVASTVFAEPHLQDPARRSS